MYDVNGFQGFLNKGDKRRNLTEIPLPPAKLDSLCNFYIAWRKRTTGNTTLIRYLDNNKINILKDDEFKVSREVLKSKRRVLRQQGKGNKPNATVALANEDIERIFDENQFGIHDPDVLSRTMWFLLTLHFGHRARHEARQMKFGDIVLRKDEASGEEYLEW